jgi:hypothetical protein
MIEYNIYDWSDGGKKHMNWRGDYTYGSVFFRGTRVYLKENCGKFLGGSDDKDFLDQELADESVFADDTIDGFKAESLDELIVELVNAVEGNVQGDDDIMTCEFTFLDKVLSDWDKYECIYTYNDRVRSDFMVNREAIESADNIFTDYDFTCVVYDFSNMVQELKEVDRIAKENDVWFCWI